MKNIDIYISDLNEGSKKATEIISAGESYEEVQDVGESYKEVQDVGECSGGSEANLKRNKCVDDIDAQPKKMKSSKCNFNNFS